MKEVKQYGIGIPLNIHTRINEYKKEKGIMSKRIILDAIKNYEFNKKHLDKEFDLKLVKKASVDIDIETYKILNNIKIDNGITLGFVILCAIDDFV